jgi:hypothetical protein
VSRDRNHSNVEQPGTGTEAERVGDITGEPPTNKAVDRGNALKLANLLEGLEFPATKEEIINHLEQRSYTVGNRINNILETIEKNLNNREYASVYDVEVAANLVEKAASEKPYVRDKALNRANRKRIGEKVRPDPYANREKIGSASARDVSPNTPKGEKV